MTEAQANFNTADDLLLEASNQRLAGHGPIEIERSGRIGPIVELALASFQFVDQYRTVSVNSEFSASLRQALHTRQPFGSNYSDMFGVFPLGEINPIASACTRWDQWVLHAENIAKSKGLGVELIASLMGAMIEIQDNIYEHSEAPATGLVAYAVTPSTFEFVVADQGMGVMQTLRRNPQYAHITDAGQALQEVIKDGVSRFPSETGRGQGFNQLFRSLVGRNAELRFRSGDHALTMRPTKDELRGEALQSQVATLNGLTVSVFYRTAPT